MSSCPAFIDLPEEEQIIELRKYLKTTGAEISEENSGAGWITDLMQVIDAMETCWKSPDEAQVEGFLTSVLSLVFITPTAKIDEVVLSLCEKVVKGGDKMKELRLRILNNLYNGVDERSPVRYNVYCAMVKLAGQTNSVDCINTNLEEVQKWMKLWNLDTDKRVNLLRRLLEAFLECKQSETASKAMVELLRSYTEDNASQARDDAHRCIVHHLAQKDMYLVDHLLVLKPIKFLEGELIHDLLTIFVRGSLHNYMEFCKANPDYIEKLGLSHELCIEKMRFLTFLSMSSDNKEIMFDTMEQQLNLTTDEVEAFLIDVVRTQLVQASIDQIQRKVVIRWSQHRTFGRQQWQQLRDMLERWRENLGTVRNNLQQLTPAT
ncbi:eukaryotic translation initiation factor 3 subunit M-like [Branchiostoma lanceolatum]|uniref:Eukaryotic translation initiation factor 3 subunit M n=1 Tax=Branchiostoma lanceolatum TaxID=7740 RepID=A0A8K0EQD3_BRALA|nr:EIF3M [Branchiostoma lanceolatum]